MAYGKTADSVRLDIGLSAALLTELFARTKAGIFGHGKLPRHLTDAAWNDAGYCLDAPSLIPAGGCRLYEFPPEDDLPALPEQLVCDRED